MYDFDEIIDRRQANSMKWATAGKRLTPAQCAADPLPMWVADMDFRVAPEITEALKREIDLGVLGYGGTPDSYVEAVLGWQQRRFGWNAKPEWLLQSPGVVNSLNMAIQAFSQPGDYVVVQSPVYIHFHYDVVINGRRLIQAPLIDTGDGYRFDAKAFEAALLPGTKLFILCNPHNPTGNVWTRGELLQMSEICARRGILVVSDEVHQDLVFGGEKRHIPFASISEEAEQNTIVCIAPSKTFNIAGLQCANVLIPNPRLRVAFRAQCERAGINLVNIMGTAACEAAYRHGEAWADEMLAYVAANQRHFAQSVKAMNLPISVTPTEALYLAWIDFRKIGMPPAELHDFLLRTARLWLDPGTKFGAGGDGFMRINLACPRAYVDEALTRLETALSR